MYALLDWDNTLRKDATLFTWEDFLIERGEMDRCAADERIALREAYKRGEITHDELSHRCCISYLRFAAGMEQGRYERLLDEYLAVDRRYLAVYVKPLMDWMRRKGIEPVVISGSPHDVIGRYREEFGIREMLDFVTPMKDGVLDGEFHGSGGHDKALATARMMERYGEPPVLAMGDSASDLPMLQAARYPIAVGGDEQLKRLFPNGPAISVGDETPDRLCDYLNTLAL